MVTETTGTKKSPPNRVINLADHRSLRAGAITRGGIPPPSSTDLSSFSPIGRSDKSIIVDASGASRVISFSAKQTERAEVERLAKIELARARYFEWDEEVRELIVVCWAHMAGRAHEIRDNFDALYEAWDLNVLTRIYGTPDLGLEEYLPKTISMILSPPHDDEAIRLNAIVLGSLILETFGKTQPTKDSEVLAQAIRNNYTAFLTPDRTIYERTLVTLAAQRALVALPTRKWSVYALELTRMWEMLMDLSDSGDNQDAIRSFVQLIRNLPQQPGQFEVSFYNREPISGLQVVKRIEAKLRRIAQYGEGSIRSLATDAHRELTRHYGMSDPREPVMTGPSPVDVSNMVTVAANPLQLNDPKLPGPTGATVLLFPTVPTITKV